MENKILEFVREFNAGLENSNEYNSLQYQNDGYQEGILLPHIYAWSDDEGEEHFRQKALSSLVRQLDLLQSVAKELLEVEITKFFAEKKKLMKEKFPQANLKYFKEATLEYSILISGLYNVELIEQFGETVEEDFQYLFYGLKISDISYI